MTDPEVRCASCLYWERGAPTLAAATRRAEPVDHLGTCQYHPPTVCVVRHYSGPLPVDRVVSEWPETHRDRCCSFWAEADPVGDPNDGDEVGAADQNDEGRAAAIERGKKILTAVAAAAASNVHPIRSRDSAPGVAAGDSGGVRSPALDAQTGVGDSLECVNGGSGCASEGDPSASENVYSAESSEPRNIIEIRSRATPDARERPADPLPFPPGATIPNTGE